MNIKPTGQAVNVVGLDEFSFGDETASDVKVVLAPGIIVDGGMPSSCRRTQSVQGTVLW